MAILQTNDAWVPLFRAALEQLPSLRVRSVKSTKQADAVVLLTSADHPVRLHVQFKKDIHPRDIPGYAYQYAHASDKAPSLPLLAADSISPGARSLLQKHQLAYWDKSGSLYLPLPSGVYFVERPVLEKKTRRVRRLFAGRRAQVFHALLLHPDARWHASDLASVAEVSPFTVLEVFRYLEEQQWMTRQGRGPESIRQLTEPGRLLDEWARHHTLKDYTLHRFYHLARTKAALDSAVTGWLGTLATSYALTLEAGAEQMAPFITSYSRVSALVAGDDFEATAKAAGFKAVDEGENTLLLSTTSQAPLMFRQDTKAGWVASNIQLYLDLMASPRRGKEQAQHLRQTRLGF